MLRAWISRNSGLLSATNHHVLCDRVPLENTVHERHRPWKLHHISAQQKRFNHGDGGQSAHMVRGGKIPLMKETIGQVLGMAAERWPHKDCMVSLEDNSRLTYSEALRRADRLAAGLLKLGLKQGDRLGIWGPNDFEWFLTFMAAARTGMILVALNPAYQLDEITYCLQKVGVRAVISPESFKTQDYPGMLLEAKRTCPILEHVIIYSKDHVAGTRRYCDVEALASRTEVEAVAAGQDRISCYSGCNIQFTSGTTGKPKATLVSHRGFVNNTRQAAERTELSAERKVCLTVPFFHAFGTIKGIMSMILTGFTAILPARSFDPVKSVEAMVREKCDVCYGTPTMWINMMDAHERLNPPPIRLFSGVTGGAPASPELFKRIRDCFHFDNIKTVYGMTETTAVVFQSLPGEANELTENTVGHLSDHAEVMVVDDKGSPVTFGSRGELWTRGYMNMIKYWNDEENTRRTLTEDGWLKTGDHFILRADGYGQIVGRAKDMVIRGGENVFPKEVEDFLMTHPAVLEAQVIGAYDAVYGEELCACVRLKEGGRLTGEELRSYCEGRIAHFKIPRYVEFVGEYPKTASGKIPKYKLKEELERKGVIPAAPKDTGDFTGKTA